MKNLINFVLVTAVTSVSFAGTVQAQEVRTAPGVWVDPDGCKHWVMDTGREGFMSPMLNRDGTPVCEGQLEPGEPIILNADALFDVDSAVIRPEGRAELDEFFTKLKGFDKSAVRVVGHTDNTGSEAYNQSLSKRRADAVAAFAAGYDVTAETEARGESEPRADNSTADGRQLNRRVEIFVL